MQKLNLNKKIREKLQYNFANNNQEYSTKGFRFLKIKKILSPVPYLFLEYKKDQKKEKIIKRKKKYKAKINIKKP